MRPARSLFPRLAIVFLLLTTDPSFGSPRVQPLDGNWWLEHGDTYQNEFLAGYIDCYSTSAGHPGFYFESWYTYRQDLTKFYEAKPANRSLPVEIALRKVWRPANPLPYKLPTGGEVWREKHGFFDGDYFDQIGNDEFREGFIGGYIHCYRMHVNAGAFPNDAANYTQLVKRYFGISGNSIDPRKEKIPIADALLRFRTGAK